MWVSRLLADTLVSGLLVDILVPNFLAFELFAGTFVS